MDAAQLLSHVINTKLGMKNVLQVLECGGAIVIVAQIASDLQYCQTLSRA